MFKDYQRRNAFYLVVHILLGVICFRIEGFSKLWGIFPLLVGTYSILNSKNKGEEGALWAAYYAGVELLLRVSGGGLSYEIGKYAVIYFLLLGAIVEKSKKRYWLFPITYFILLLPSLFLSFTNDVVELRKIILFNLSGPLSLAVAVLYFRRRVMNQIQIERIIVSIISPILAAGVYILLKAPDLSEIEFTSESNFEASGGFGPNQVSTVFGVGITLLSFSLIQRMRLFKYEVIPILVGLFFLYRGIVTLSRGGILSAAISIFLCLLISYLLQPSINIKKVLRLSFFSIVLILVSMQGWNFLNEQTGGQLYNRYSGRSTTGEELEDLTSRRTLLLDAEFQIFWENPVTGIGLGMAQVHKDEMFNTQVASHNEFGRLLAEHGMLGVIIICMLVYLLINDFFKKVRVNKIGAIWMTTTASLAVLTLNHSAMRVAMPGFLIGLSLIYILQPALSKRVTPNQHAHA